jgi:hypothetical protein
MTLPSIGSQNLELSTLFIGEKLIHQLGKGFNRLVKLITQSSRARTRTTTFSRLALKAASPLALDKEHIAILVEVF